MRMLQVLTNGALAPSETKPRLGITYRPIFLADYLHPAWMARWADMTIPDKPTSRLQRYRLTEAGQALVQQERP